jgi:hypothetical protein
MLDLRNKSWKPECVLSFNMSFNMSQRQGIKFTYIRQPMLNFKTRDKVNQLLSHGRWFSPGTPASFTTKTGRHDIAEILLKVALSTIIQIIKSNITIIR